MPTNMTSWTQALLGNHMLLSSHDAEEVRMRVAALLNDHVLEPGGATLAAKLHGVQADALSLWRLEYGEAVSVKETRPGGEFLIVQLPLTGTVTVQCDEGQWSVSPGTGLIMPSSVPHQLSWEAGAAQIILKVPLQRLHEQYFGLTGSTSRGPLRFDREITLKATDGEQWSALLRYFCEQVAQPHALGWLKVKTAEEALIRHLLCAQSATLRTHFLGEDSIQVPQRLQRARAYIEAHLSDDITLDDIARHSNTSPRTLTRMCRLQYGVSPMQLVRDLRLDQIRQALINATVDNSVSEIALRWGYTHLGRFAAAYRQRFGEAPHDTLQKKRRGMQPFERNDGPDANQNHRH